MESAGYCVPHCVFHCVPHSGPNVLNASGTHTLTAAINWPGN